MEHHVSVYLIGHEYNALGAAYRCHAGQGCLVPLQTYGIVRIADNHHSRSLACYDVLEVVEVHDIVASAVKLQGIGNHASAVALYDAAERVVHRRLNQDAVSGTAEIIDAQAQSFLQSGHECYFIGLNMPSVTSIEPRNDTIPKIGGSGCVSQYGMVETSAQCINDAWTSFKIHVGDPKRQ